MADKMKLMCILAHPDDESLAMGGTLAKYAAQGVEIHLITATRGERGWPWDKAAYPGPEQLGQRREAELHAAAHVLGLHRVEFLNYLDGELDNATPAEVLPVLVASIRRVRPHVVVTFDPNGCYGHPDHIAISHLALAAVVRAADPHFGATGNASPHAVSKFYYIAPSSEQLELYQTVIGELAIPVDGVLRRAIGWEPWAITTTIDAESHWQTVWQAVSCHQSQLPNLRSVEQESGELHKQLWGCQTYYRAFSLVNGGRKMETDLFEGLVEGQS